jgi:hypothetical protein
LRSLRAIRHCAIPVRNTTADWQFHSHQPAFHFMQGLIFTISPLSWMPGIHAFSQGITDPVWSIDRVPSAHGKKNQNISVELYVSSSRLDRILRRISAFLANLSLTLTAQFPWTRSKTGFGLHS